MLPSPAVKKTIKPLDKFGHFLISRLLASELVMGFLFVFEPQVIARPTNISSSRAKRNLMPVSYLSLIIQPPIFLFLLLAVAEN